MKKYRSRGATRRRLAALAAVAAVLAGVGIAVAQSGSSRSPGAIVDRLATDVGAPPAAPPPAPVRVRRVRTLRIGDAVRGVVVLRPEPAPPRPPAVLFIHGWGLTHVGDYGPWLRHLARAGNVVIFPRYQLNEQSNPGLARRDMLAGLRSALSRVPIDTSSLVVAGHSAGAAMAADYAAISGRGGRPRPVGVFVVYPGRAILGYPAGIPPADYGRIARPTRLLVMAGANDSVVGQAPALGIYREASRIPRSRRRYVLVTRPGVSDHYAPTRATRRARVTFWRRLDRLIASARG